MVINVNKKLKFFTLSDLIDSAIKAAFIPNFRFLHFRKHSIGFSATAISKETPWWKIF